MPSTIGIDLGSYKTIIATTNRVLLEQPSIVAVDADTWEPICYGKKVYDMIDKTPPSIEIVYPIQRGVVADYELTEKMLKHFMNEAFSNTVLKPQIMVAMPFGVTSVQHRSVAKAIELSGGRNVKTIEAPLADAIAFKCDFSKPHGYLVADIGAGTTDIAVISMGGFVKSESIPVASFDFDEAIIRYVKKKYSVNIGHRTAEHIKCQIGGILPRDITITMKASGMENFSRKPKVFEITSNDVRLALADPVKAIYQGIRKVIEKTPPDIVADIAKDGIFLTGGGSELFGIKEYLSSKLGIKVNMYENPERSVAKGTALALKYPKLTENGDYQYRALADLIVDDDGFGDF